MKIRSAFSVFSVLRFAAVLMPVFSGCSSFVSQSQQPLIIITPSILDFTGVGASSSTKVELRSNIKKRITVDTIYANAPGLVISGRTKFVMDSLGSHTFIVGFNWKEFNNAANASITIETDLTGYERIQAQVLTPVSREEIALTSAGPAFTKQFQRPVKFAGNGNVILFHRSHLPADSLLPRVDVFTMNLVGENIRQISTSWGGQNSYGVDLSSGGTRVLYYTERADGARNMYIWSEDGVDTLTRDGFINTPVAFSPNGQRVLFNSNRTGGSMDAYYMNLNPRSIQRLTETANREEAICWSKDGTRVLIRSVINNQPEIMLSTLIGPPLRLTSNSVRDEPVGFSPAGNRILFYSERNFRREIYTMAINGSDVVQLTSNQVFDYPVMYMPDGNRILFYSVDYANNAEIYVMDAIGGQQSIRRITALPYSEYPVDVTADGRTILYWSPRAPGYPGADIYLTRIDNTPTTPAN